jgi:hypothetical protein
LEPLTIPIIITITPAAAAAAAAGRTKRAVPLALPKSLWSNRSNPLRPIHP